MANTTNASMGEQTMSYGTVQAEKMTTESGYSLGAGNASSFKNRIINGNMDINQRSFSGNAVEFGYTLDRWITFIGTSATWSVSQNTNSVTPPSGFTDYLGVTSLASTTPATNARNLLCQMIEGYNIADWAWGYASAKPVTLSFWVRSSLTGTFGASICSTDQVVSATFSYTINAANTWEYKTITVQGPTTGAVNWNTTNGRGLWLFFDMGTGSDFALDTTWGSAAKYTIGGSRTNVIGTNGATWYLTGVQLEVGTVATSFDYRPYGTELALCQRYCFVITYDANNPILFTGYWGTANALEGFQYFPVTMRTIPSLTVPTIGSLYCLEAQVAWRQATSISIGEGSPNGIKVAIACGTNTSFAKGQGGTGGLRATGNVQFIAEL
jgi:hypothetical protein